MHLESFILKQYRSIPVISRLFFTASILITLLTYLNIISSYSLIYSWPYMKRAEIWRALTTFFYWGPASLDVFLHQFFMLRYCIMLEESSSTSAEFLYMLMVGMGIIFGLSNIVGISKMSNSLSTYIIYIWSKKNPLIIVQYMGIFNLPAYYIPYIMMLFSFMMDKTLPKNDIIGILAGHTYFYFKNVYTKTSGSDPLRTPIFLENLLGNRNPTNRATNSRR